MASFMLGTLSSCLGETDAELVYYDDAGVTKVSLGTLNQYLHKTLDNGKDSSYKRTLDGSKYAFRIDQVNGKIWNPDSLPKTVDAKHVICNISTKNGSAVGIKSMTSDSLYAYISSDSIDFTQPRELWIYSTNRTGYKKYTLTLNVHKEYGDSCIWNLVQPQNASVGELKNMRLRQLGDKMYLFGTTAGATKIYSMPVTDGTEWTEVVPSVPLGEAAAANCVAFNDAFYALENGQILTSADAETWTVVADVTLDRLVAASSTYLYAMQADKMMSSFDNGATWQEETMDDEAAKLPTESISFVCQKSSTNDNMEFLTMVGMRDINNYDTDSTAVVWTKMEEKDQYARKHPWSYIEFAKNNKYKAPLTTNLQTTCYNGTIMALAGQPLGNCTKEALQFVYCSKDNGITWTKDSIMYLPKDLETSNTDFAFAADSKNYVWLVAGGSGQLWKGHINCLLWKKEKNEFTKED